MRTTTKARVPSISEIEEATRGESPYFFTPDTLRFFGQYRSSFRVRRTPSGRLFIYAPMRDRGRLNGFTFREVVGMEQGNGDLAFVYQCGKRYEDMTQEERVAAKMWEHDCTREQIEDFCAEH